jgi:uncharacterized membrane protein (GlpM family)
MSELLLRFVIGGLVVSLFAVLGDIFRPRNFAGIFAAAPSIAFASVGLTIHQHGREYAAIEARSMIFGALAFLLYAAGVGYLLRRFRTPALTTTVAMMAVWLAVSLGCWFLLLRPR